VARADKIKDVVKDIAPAGVPPNENPIIEIRPMPDIIPTPGVGNYAHVKGTAAPKK
jgi:hypothetical protein